jgi:filamentous hemagglutinin
MGSGTAFAAAGTSATGAAVSAGWANATLSGIAAGSISQGVGAAVQGNDWRTPALYGGITGGFVGYLTGGTYYNNTINSVRDAGSYIAHGNWEALGNMGLDIATTQAAGRIEAKVANELGMNGDQLNWLLMAGSIVGNELSSVGTRYKTVTDEKPDGEKDFGSTGGTGMRGYDNRGTLGLLFDTVDVVLGYQGLPDASVASAAYNQDANGINQPSPQNLTCHSLGTVTCSYLARNGLAGGNVYLASVPFGVVAPLNTTVFLGTGDAVNGFYGGQIFNWNATVVPIQFITGHPYENYKTYVDEAAKNK